MAQIEVMVSKQLLTIQNQDVIARGDMNYDICAFSFDRTWEDFVKTAVFYQDKSNVQYVVLNSDNTCIIPASAMVKEGNMYIGVFGISGAKVLTSTVGRVYIRQGAISGGDVNTEPSDDVFLAIIAQYQRIAALMQEYESTAKEFNIKIAEQNEILSALNAFDVTELMSRLDLIEERMISYANTAKEIMGREIVLRNVAIKFMDKICRIESESITAESLCDVYFDEYSYEIAAKALILPISYDGYLELSSSIDIKEELNGNVLVRRS